MPRRYAEFHSAVTELAAHRASNVTRRQAIGVTVALCALRLGAAKRANRDHDADHRDNRTDDGPGRRIAHRAPADDAEALQSPQQAEQENDHSDNRDGNAHPFTVGATLAMMER
jgi:hypothetical protein